MPANDNIITGRHYLTGEMVRVCIDGGLITEMSAIRTSVDSELIIAPGLVDLQVNGYAGHDLNTDPLLPQTVKEIAVRLWREGVTTFFPTIITNSSDNISRSLAAIAEACRSYPEAASAVGGIHLEGPFISPEDGARGAHPAEYVVPPDWELFCRWQEACNGMIRIITLSPEWPSSADFIRKAAESNVIVSIGHTAAKPEQIREAVDAGALLSTHLGNGSHAMLPRHRNYLWEQLAADELYATIISDGFHLPDPVMKVFLRMKPGKVILVSDATSLTGMEPGNYTTHIGGEVTLTDAGKLHMRGNPDMLAGSGKSLLHCVETLVSKDLASASEALDMAGRIPYRLAGLPGEYRLSPGGVADLILLRAESSGLSVKRTIKEGRTLFVEEI
ncbi:MAG: amidohydrolase family protein [Bacteroidales bacterium]|jgi:N-acetylglucosamine-6-phosphate deacetylase|nr:amidohydrolase family protein [Bacteroidales bacterium]NLE34399.1 amidohydrolase family protein [Bacteroidales bacterium]HOO66471.1 amidohydrolase family protein [Bacteroidales bacterium]HPE22849.1 amidohydrolase family protein [Bacteroidales bacterium]HPJ05395.1 amidohydrolase family protein [Bacteroidales bacterium]